MIDMVNGLGVKLRRMRKALQLSEEYVAKQVGVDRHTIAEIESCARGVSPDELARFSEIYCTPAEELLSQDVPQVSMLKGLTIQEMQDMMEFKRMMKG